MATKQPLNGDSPSKVPLSAPVSGTPLPLVLPYTVGATFDRAQFDNSEFDQPLPSDNYSKVPLNPPA